MLTQYLTRTKRLLQNPGAPPSLYADADLTDYINESRGQIAGEGECIRVLASASTVINQRNYPFSGIALGASATTGVQAVLHVRRIMYQVGVGPTGVVGERWMRPRNWEWFDLYKLNNPVPAAGAPELWAQYAQGTTGSFYIDPLPDFVYNLSLDCVCYPINLVDDSTVEAIPYMWTDAVPFLAAYFALLSAQSGQRQADADRMMDRYSLFTARARKASNPSVNRYLYQQSVDPTQINKLSLPQGKQGAA